MPPSQILPTRAHSYRYARRSDSCRSRTSPLLRTETTASAASRRRLRLWLSHGQRRLVFPIILSAAAALLTLALGRSFLYDDSIPKHNGSTPKPCDTRGEKHENGDGGDGNVPIIDLAPIRRWRQPSERGNDDDSNNDRDKFGGAALCAIAKYENPYIDEWLDYNRGVLGFDQIYIFDNSDCEESSSGSASPKAPKVPWDGYKDLKEKGADKPMHRRNRPDKGVHVISFPGSDSPQLKAYDRCLGLIRQGNEAARKEEANRLVGSASIRDPVNKTKTIISWAAFFDVDEYLVLKSGEGNEPPHVVEFLQDVLPPRPKAGNSGMLCSFFKWLCPSPGSISINWYIFGTNNETNYRPLPVTSRFRYRDAAVNRHVKTIATVDAIRRMSNPHSPILQRGHYSIDSSGRVLSRRHPFDPNGDTSPFNPNGPTDRVVLHHYRTKSEEEYRFKGCFKGRSDMTPNSTMYHSNCKSPSRPGTIRDEEAWTYLKEFVPSYANRVEFSTNIISAVNSSGTHR